MIITIKLRSSHKHCNNVLPRNPGESAAKRRGRRRRADWDPSGPQLGASLPNTPGTPRDSPSLRLYFDSSLHAILPFPLLQERLIGFLIKHVPVFCRDLSTGGSLNPRHYPGNRSAAGRRKRPQLLPLRGAGRRRRVRGSTVYLSPVEAPSGPTLDCRLWVMGEVRLIKAT